MVIVEIFWAFMKVVFTFLSIINLIAHHNLLILKLMRVRGFTLIELIVVVVIIVVLSSIGVFIYFRALNKAYKVRVGADFYTLQLNIDVLRRSQRITLHDITGSFCSLCNFCDGGVDVRSSSCVNQMRQQYKKITNEPLPFDPWYNPYLFDEEDTDPLLGTGCFGDKLYSAGPDHIYSGGASHSDDMVFTSSPISCGSPSN